MRHYRTVLGSALLLLSLHAAEARNIQLVLGKGETVHEVDFPVASMYLENDNIVSVELADREIRLMPLSAGRTRLILYDGDRRSREEWNVFVSRGIPVSAETVQEFLKDESGTPIKTLFCEQIPGTDMVKITGLIRDLSHYEKIRKAVNTFEGNVVNLAKVDDQFFESIAAEIRKKVAIPGIGVTHAGDRLFLTGLVYSQAEQAYVEAIGRAIYPYVDSFVTVRPQGIIDRSIEKPLIQLECQILEITTDAARRVGIDWGGMLPITVSAGWQAERGAGAPSGFVSIDTDYLVKALIPQIESGDARVLYTQNLVCENGEDARFFAGGSFWITATVPGSGEVSVEEVEFGIGMELHPVADKFDNIGTKVNIEFSSLGPDINDFPSLLKRYVRTSVNVKRGQTLSLGSLLGSDMRESIKRVPLLGDIPVLGQLFRSEQYQKGESQMVVLITPRIVKPEDAENMEAYQQIEDKMSR